MKGIESAWKGGEISGEGKAYTDVALYCLRLSHIRMVPELLDIAEYCKKKLVVCREQLDNRSFYAEAEAVSRH